MTFVLADVDVAAGEVLGRQVLVVPWSRYHHWTRRNGIVLKGFPLPEIPKELDGVGAVDLRLIKNHLLAGTCRWERLSGDEHEQLLETEGPPKKRRAPRSDKNKKRKKQKVSNAKSKEFIDDEDEEEEDEDEEGEDEDEDEPRSRKRKAASKKQAEKESSEEEESD